ncbi:MAG: hypothetical protein ABIN93_09490 [Ginsengibacter sp.]
MENNAERSPFHLLENRFFYEGDARETAIKIIAAKLIANLFVQLFKTKNNKILQINIVMK